MKKLLLVLFLLPFITWAQKTNDEGLEAKYHIDGERVMLIGTDLLKSKSYVSSFITHRLNFASIDANGWPKGMQILEAYSDGGGFHKPKKMQIAYDFNKDSSQWICTKVTITGNWYPVAMFFVNYWPGMFYIEDTKKQHYLSRIIGYDDIKFYGDVKNDKAKIIITKVK